MSQLDQRFSSQVVLVTGSGSGIGAAVAERAAIEGADVVVVDRDEAAAERTVAAITDAGCSAMAVAADVTRGDEVAAAVASSIRTFGHVDVLVNNAGVTNLGSVLDTTDEDFDRVVRTNLYGSFAFTRAVAPSMIERRYGRVVNISSRAYLGEARMSIYGATKAAINGFTRSVSLELAPYGITVNAVAPGAVQTPLRASTGNAAALDAKTASTTPIGRVGDPDELAAAVLFVASREASYITGAVVPVTGGRYWSSSPFGTLG